MFNSEALLDWLTDMIAEAIADLYRLCGNLARQALTSPLIAIASCIVCNAAIPTLGVAGSSYLQCLGFVVVVRLLVPTTEVVSPLTAEELALLTEEREGGESQLRLVPSPDDS